MKTQRTVYTANLLLVAFAISAAIAQESDVHVIMPNSYRASCPSNLLRTIEDEDVQTELRLTMEQVEKISVIARTLKENALPGKPDGRIIQQKIEEFYEKRRLWVNKSVRREYEALNDVLTPSQMKRLMEIHIQFAGVVALTTDEVARACGLTVHEQDVVSKAYREAMTTSRMRLHQRDRNKQISPLAAREEAEKMVEDHVLDVLTEAQRARFGEIKGLPWNIAKARHSSSVESSDIDVEHDE